MSKQRPDPSKDQEARDVERLLRQLRQLDGPEAPTSAPQRPQRFTPAARTRPLPRPSPPWLPSYPGVWARVALAALLGAAIIQWPYAGACGAGLVVKGTSIGVLVVAGLWSAAASWRRRMASAHVAALFIIAWSIGLLANEVLPRTGYAAQAATWRCHPPRASAPAPLVAPSPTEARAGRLLPPVRVAKPEAEWQSVKFTSPATWSGPEVARVPESNP